MRCLWHAYELALQSANGSNSDKDREAMQKEMGQLQEEMNRIADTTSFGGQNLLDGSFGSRDFQIGANSNETQSLGLMDVSSHALGRDYKKLDAGPDAVEVKGGTSTGDGKFSLNIGNNTHDIDITKDMSADDLKNKLNNIDGVSNIGVTETEREVTAATASTSTVSGLAAKDATASTTTVTNLALGATDTIELKIADVNVTLDSAALTDKDTLMGAINGALDNAGKGHIRATATDATGFSLTSSDGSEVALEATIQGSDSGTTLTMASQDGATAGAQTLVGNGTKTGETKTTGGVAGESVDFNIGGKSISLDSTVLGDKTKLQEELNKAFDGTENIILTANDSGDGFSISSTDGSEVDISATINGTDANTTATITGADGTGTQALIGNDPDKLTGETQTSGGVAAVTEKSFTVDFSDMKLDSDIESMSYSTTKFDGTEEQNVAMDLGAETITESVAGLDLSTQAGAQNAIDVLDAAMEQIDSKRAEIGAFQNRMNHTMNNLVNINENVAASNSRIKDVDFASETVNMTKGQILQQAGTSILAQAKQIPQSALSLLG
ncbi:flagellin [Photobacterium damselae subsp. damselae]|nr:flagellin [Photobacterium damselae]NVH50462.1 flagellin [Photobacterium damselae subsp. damselae]NVO83239.1 flagellin [Photobacterium damselae subsp. damselae]